MKTVLLGIALAGLVASSGAIAHDTAQTGGGAIEYRPGTGSLDSRVEIEAPVMPIDRDVYEVSDDGGIASDGGIAFAAPDGSSYSYDGDWRGQYIDPQARVFEGDWSGRVTRHGGVSGPGYPAPQPVAPAVAPYREPAYQYDEHYKVQRGYGWQGGYYYYPQSAGVTVISGGPVTTTTTTVTEETYYETVAAPRKRVVRKWKPKPAPRCVC